MQANDHFICPNCHVGYLDLKLTTYVRKYEETMICVPNTPCWVCDVCHERHFDPSAIQRLELLIGPVGPPPNRHQPVTRPAKRAEQRPDATAKPGQKAK